MPGPPPKPTALKVLEGNPGKRRLNDREPKPTVGCRPPDWLAGEALVEWEKHAPRLERLGLLTEIDGEALAALCVLLVQFATEAQAEEPKTSKLMFLSKELRGLWSRFGMTPADRSRVKVEKKDKPESKLQRFRGAS